MCIASKYAAKLIDSVSTDNTTDDAESQSNAGRYAE